MKIWYPTPPTSTTAAPGCFSRSVPERRAIIATPAWRRGSPYVFSPCPRSSIGHAGLSSRLDLRLQLERVRLARVDPQRLLQRLERLLVAAVDVQRVGEGVVEERQAQAPSLRLLHEAPRPLHVVLGTQG